MNCDGYGLLIDLGIGIRLFKRSFSNYGLSIASIRSILVTHDHTDHVKAVGALSGEFQIPVYTSQRVHDSIALNHHVNKKVPKPLRQIIAKNETIELGPFNVTSFHVPHDSADNNGYIIRADGKCFVILTDVGHFTEEMQGIIAQATHLVIESNYDVKMLACGRYPQRLQNRISSPNGHISNAETASFLAENLNPELIKGVWLCHLSAENNLPRIACEETSKALTQKGFIVDGEGKNLYLEVLPRRTPTLYHDLDALIR